MAYKKYYFQEITIPADNGQHQFPLATPDNFQQQTVTELYATITTARNVFGIIVNGDLLLTVPAPRFANGNHPVHCSIVVEAGTAPVVTAQDLTGSGTANVGILIGYEVNQQ